MFAPFHIFMIGSALVQLPDLVIMILHYLKKRNGSKKRRQLRKTILIKESIKASRRRGNWAQLSQCGKDIGEDTECKH